MEVVRGEEDCASLSLSSVEKYCWNACQWGIPTWRMQQGRRIPVENAVGPKHITFMKAEKCVKHAIPCV